jgi:hypothetical protein
VRRELEQLLAERFGCAHTTLQVDHDRSGGLVTIASLHTPTRAHDRPR